MRVAGAAAVEGVVAEAWGAEVQVEAWVEVQE